MPVTGAPARSGPGTTGAMHRYPAETVLRSENVSDTPAGPVTPACPASAMELGRRGKGARGAKQRSHLARGQLEPLAMQ